MSVDVSPARCPDRKRKSTHPSGGKKKQGLPPRTPEDCDPVVREVVEDTRAAVEEMMKELNNMVDATPQTSPPEFIVTNVYDKAEAKDPSPPPLQDDNEGLKRMMRMATIFESPGFQNPKPVPPPSSVDYTVCPCHDVRLEARESQKG